MSLALNRQQRENVCKMYTQALAEKNNNVDGGGRDASPSGGGAPRRKPNRDVAELYKQKIAESSPPTSPQVAPRARPAKDITQLYTGKLEAPAAANGTDKVSPKKVRT